MRPPVDDTVLRILGRITSAPDLTRELDTDLFEAGLLDSLGLVSLMVAFGDELGLAIYPSDLDKKAWATPRKMIADIERRAAASA